MFTEAIETLLRELEILKEEGGYPNIDRPTAQYLYEMVMREQPAQILEVGGCNGYSTIWLGLAASTYGGQVTTIEWSDDRYEALSRNVQRVGLTNITPLHADAKTVLAAWDTPVQFVFLDAMKREYLVYAQLLKQHLQSGGVLVADNIHSHADKLKDFVEYVTMDDAFEVEILELGTGLLIARKR